METKLTLIVVVAASRAILGKGVSVTWIVEMVYATYRRTYEFA